MDTERDVLQVELLLGVPWVVGVPATVDVCEPLAATGSAAPVASEPDEAAEAEHEAHEPFLMAVGLTAVWGVLAAVMLLGGVLTPAAGNAVFMVTLVAGLICVALVVVTCPRPDAQETFWTWGSEAGAAVGQCTPSRVTFTQRGER